MKLAMLLLALSGMAQTPKPAKPPVAKKAAPNGSQGIPAVQSCLASGDCILEPEFLRDCSKGECITTSADNGGVSVPSHTGRIDPLSDNEYAALTQLREALAKKEKEIAAAHGVYIEGEHCALNPESLKGPCSQYPQFKDMAAPPDTWEIRGAWLLVNVPQGGGR